ncbi:MAG: T9SS type A sorting domain-containing protein [bacterium]|nr:T9SS type A sorting domain-containing protein [bacterium]
MKKGLILCLALVLAFAMVATAKKMDPRANLVTKDGDAPVVKSSGAKLPGVGQIVSATGYGDAWRATAGMAGKSICSDPSGTYLGMVYGISGSPCDLIFGYSLDGGATWGTQTIWAAANPSDTRCYNGLAFDAAITPYIAWQDRTNNSIQWSKDEGGIGAGLWVTPDTLARDSVAWYIPGFAISGNKMVVSAFSHGNAAPFGDFSIHASISSDLGATWDAALPRNPLPYGWSKWGYNEISGQGWDLDEADWLISGSGDTVIAYFDLVGDTMMYANDTYSSFFPVYKTSYDGGTTWQPMQTFAPPAQYWYGGWWYMYDGAWIGDKPYFLFTWQDGTWNGNALFVYFPTVAGDYSAWTCQRISDIPGTLAGVTPGDLNGSAVNFPCLSSDAAGNIYATYNDYPKNSDSYEIFGVASTDGGTTWKTPVQLTTEAPEFDGNYYMEAAEVAGGDNIHLLFHDPAYTNIYYWSVPTATILAGTTRPDEITLAPDLVNAIGGGWGGPVDATMDTLSATGDTLTTYWSPKVAIGGTYEVQICKSADFSSSDVYQLSDAGLNVNYITVVGLPDTNVVWNWRVRSIKVANSPWSAVFDFYYKGTTVDSTPWTNLGVEGTPTGTTAHKFSLNQNRPNPVNKLAELSFTLPKSGNYSLKIYNIAGQVIRNLDGKGNAGQNTVTWNGMDNGGRKVANGVYLYNLNAFGNSATKKLVVVR